MQRPKETDDNAAVETGAEADNVGLDDSLDPSCTAIPKLSPSKLLKIVQKFVVFVVGESRDLIPVVRQF